MRRASPTSLLVASSAPFSNGCLRLIASISSESIERSRNTSAVFAIWARRRFNSASSFCTRESFSGLPSSPHDFALPARSRSASSRIAARSRSARSMSPCSAFVAYRVTSRSGRDAFPSHASRSNPVVFSLVTVCLLVR